MKGSEIQQGVIDLARRLGWKVAHFHAVRHAKGFHLTPVAADGKGFPDLLLVRDRVVAIEIKGSGDSLRPEQTAWLTAFRLAGVDTLVVTPAVYKTDAVEDLLSRRGPAP